MKSFVFQSIKQGLFQGKLSLSQRQGVLKLLPKKDRNILWLENWRPITLLNVDRKIFTEALADRIRRVISTLVHPDQRGFIPHRFIGSNIMDIYAAMAHAGRQ